MSLNFKQELKMLCANSQNVVAIMEKIMQETPSEFLDFLSGSDEYAMIWWLALKDYKEFGPVMSCRYFLFETKYEPLAQRYPSIKEAFRLVTRGDSKYYLRKQSKHFGGFLKEAFFTPTNLIAIYKMDVSEIGNHQTSGRVKIEQHEHLTFMVTNLTTMQTRKSDEYINKLKVRQECHMCWTRNEILISVGNLLFMIDPVSLIVDCNNKKLKATILELKKEEKSDNNDDENNKSSSRGVTIITKTGHFEYASGKIKKKD